MPHELVIHVCRLLQVKQGADKAKRAVAGEPSMKMTELTHSLKSAEERA